MKTYNRESIGTSGARVEAGLRAHRQLSAEAVFAEIEERYP